MNTSRVGWFVSTYVHVLTATKKKIRYIVLLDQPCAAKPCLNGGTCKKVDGKKFTCTCLPGYSGDRCQERGKLLNNYKVNEIFSIYC